MSKSDRQPLNPSTPEDGGDSDDLASSEEDLPVAELTWAALLGHWIDFARSALALAEEGEAGRMRESVPDIIALQATWFALGDLSGLAEDEQALGLNRAGELIRRHGAALEARWATANRTEADMPSGISELLEDARSRLAAMRRDPAESSDGAPSERSDALD